MGRGMLAPTYKDKLATAVQRFDRFDTELCTLLNRTSRFPAVRMLFRVVSRLGNGIFWYSLMAALPLVAGRDGALIALHLGLTSVAGVAIYQRMKARFGRERPYVHHDTITCATPPLDRYSFPSGHTLHAVSFTAIACIYLPPLAWVLVPFTALVAMSRMILGLHYPTDVLVGAIIGAMLALLSFQVTGLPF